MSDIRDKAEQPKSQQPTPVEQDAQRLRAIADAVPALIAYVDAAQRYQFNNEGYAAWFGRTPSQLRGLHVRELLGPAAYEVVRPDIEAVLSGQPVSYEKLVPYERGSRWTHTQFVPDASPDGTVRGFVALVTDISERKRAEEEMASVQQQLVLADRLATVGTLAMGVAHEVNNPLAIVIGNQGYVATGLARLLEACTHEQKSRKTGKQESREDRKTEEAAKRKSSLAEFKARTAVQIAALEEPLRDAREAADRVRRIIRDLDVFSCPNSERRVPVDLRRVLASAVNMLADDIRPRAHLVEDYADAAPVRANEALLGQVFLNLLQNALQAVTERASPRHEVRVVAREQSGQVVVEVSDTGAGIPADRLSHIFEPFYTTDWTRHGSGLGLWVAGRIVSDLGGKLTADSQVGRGSVFTVTLPALSPSHL